MSITARVVYVYVCSEPPKVEEPEEWKEQQLSTVELYIQTHNKNPVEMVSLKTAVSQSLHVLLLNLHPPHLFRPVRLSWQRLNDSLMICAEPDNFTVGEFITVG